MLNLRFITYFELLLVVVTVFSETARKHHFYDIIYPGTKWCGPGNVADNYDDLGPEQQSDNCCRRHDHCPDLIESGQTKHNLTNYAFYTKLHCTCDDEFLTCLKKVELDEEKTANGVGHIYFNMLETKCFRKEYPIIRCIRYAKTSRRCEEFEYNKTAPKKWQWFDVPQFD